MTAWFVAVYPSPKHVFDWQSRRVLEEPKIVLGISISKRNEVSRQQTPCRTDISDFQACLYIHSFMSNECAFAPGTFDFCF